MVANYFLNVSFQALQWRSLIHLGLTFTQVSKLLIFFRYLPVDITSTFVIILHSYSFLDSTTTVVDVLADEAIRQGVKEFSQWPTIPQLYVCGEFIGGSDIMIEMYQSGELGEMIEKAKADMI